MRDDHPVDQRNIARMDEPNNGAENVAIEKEVDVTINGDTTGAFY